MDAAIVGAGVRTRLADVDAAIERHAAFVFTGDDHQARGDATDDPGARDFVLRSFGAVSDAANYRILFALLTADASFSDVAENAGLGDVATWERVNDLIQAGLVARAADRDLIGLSASGQEFVQFVEAATAAAEAEMGPVE